MPGDVVLTEGAAKEIFKQGKGSVNTGLIVGLAAVGILGVTVYFVYEHFFGKKVTTPVVWIPMTEIDGLTVGSTPSSTVWTQVMEIDSLAVGSMASSTTWVQIAEIDGLSVGSATAGILWFNMMEIDYLRVITPPIPIPAGITASSSPANGGTVSFSLEGPYIENDVVGLTAHPNSGWYFSHWDISGVTYSDNPHTITLIASNVIVTAYFQQAAPPAGPQFPAPSSPAGDTWYWVVFTDGSAGWFDTNAVESYPNGLEWQPNQGNINWTLTKGPYVSGATG
jgi:hypothetical protein